MANWNRLEIFERDGFHCLYCGFDGSTFESWPFLEVDHINPTGARDDGANLATCCHRCNSWKGNDPCESVDQAKAIIAKHRKINLDFWQQKVVPLLHPSMSSTLR